MKISSVHKGTIEGSTLIQDRHSNGEKFDTPVSDGQTTLEKVSCSTYRHDKNRNRNVSFKA